MRFVVFTVLCLNSLLSASQSVISSCNAHDSIIEKYEFHAAQLALRRIYDNNFTEVDSVIIPSASRDSVLNAIIAVYNAVGLPARDTIMSFNISPVQTVPVRWIRIEADSNATWMQSLLNLNVPTGNMALDSLMSEYNCTITYVSNPVWSYIAIAKLELDDYYNLDQILENIVLDTLNGMININTVEGGFDQDDITYNVFAGYRQLNYIHKWGDCPAGCNFSRTWTFNIFDDCSVEYVGSFGDYFVGLNELSNNNQIIVSPNPVIDELFIHLKSGDNPLKFSVVDVFGNLLIEGVTSEGRIDLSNLSGGTYFVSIRNNEINTTRRIIKL